MALLVAPSLKAPRGSRGTAVRIILRLAAVQAFIRASSVVRVASACLATQVPRSSRPGGDAAPTAGRSTVPVRWCRPGAVPVGAAIIPCQPPQRAAIRHLLYSELGPRGERARQQVI